MSLAPIHAAGADLPLPLDQAVVVLWTALAVLLLVAVDLYRYRWWPGVGD